MNIEQNEQPKRTRRSFFAGLAAEGTVPLLIRETVNEKPGEPVTVTIHPLAVSRTNESAKSHGE